MERFIIAENNYLRGIAATNLTAAKRAATRGQLYQQTQLTVMTTSHRPLAVKPAGGTWQDINIDAWMMDKEV